MARKKVEALTLDLANFYQIARNLIDLYCVDRDIDSNKIEPLKWNGILLYIFDNTIALDRDILKDVYPDCTSYDIDKVYKLYEDYKRLCYEFEQIINLTGFSYISGIRESNIVDWGNVDEYIINNNINTIKEIESKYIDEYGEVIDDSYKWDCSYRKKLYVIKCSEISKLIKRDNQASLESRMLDHSTNAMKVLPSLNRWHGWNLPHVSREEKPKRALTASELPDIPKLDNANQGAIESKD